MFGEDSDEEFEPFTAEEVAAAEEELQRYRREHVLFEDDFDCSDSELELVPRARRSGNGVVNTARSYSRQAYADDWLRPFDERTGPLLHSENDDGGEIFSHFFDAEVFALLTDETNRYAEQYFDVHPVAELLHRSRLRDWSGVTVADMRAFIAIILIMGEYPRDSYAEYWTTVVWAEMPGFRAIMSRDRFLLILTFFHVSNNEEAIPRGQPGHRRTFKIDGLTGMLLDRWQKAYYPGRDVSVDEMMIAFKGRCQFIVYHPQKPHKWGLQAWTLSDSRTGYVYNYKLYAGRDPDPPPENLPQAHNAVLRSAGPILVKGHHVYMDNFFSSPSLFDDLASQQTGACGTLRINRQGVPPLIKATKLKKGQPQVVVRDGLKLYISWFDKKQVNLVTTVHNDQVMEKTVRARGQPEHRRTIQKPCAIQLYTDNMRGVDLIDQKISYSLHTHKSLKWWKKMFMVLLEISVRHSHIIHRHFHSQVSAKKVRASIVSSLLHGYQKTTVYKHRPPVDPPLRLTERHWPEPSPEITQGGRSTSRDCIVCSDRSKKRCQTKSRCHQCGYAMCVWPCWMRYHTLVDYKADCSKEYHQPSGTS